MKVDETREKEDWLWVGVQVVKSAHPGSPFMRINIR
jgi:hypothetical protein